MAGLWGLGDGTDLTDYVKGRRQYFIRFDAGAKALADSGLTLTTVCQANVSILPRLKDDGSKVSFAASNRAIVSAGPNREQAKAHVVAGAFDSPAVTLELAAPRHEAIIAIYAAAHVASGNPPPAETKYQIEYSTDNERTWKPVVKDWVIPRRGEEPGDFWSQSFCYGAVEIPQPVATPIRIRFRNNGAKKYLRAEAHLVYRTAASDASKVTFNWTDESGPRRESHIFGPGQGEPWHVDTAKNVQTRWVEFEALTR